jgi:pseudaminic acid biosynthesis-associated methylase
MAFKTDQENFWAGKFGNEYIDRNSGKKLLASNLHFFSNSLKSSTNISTCIEFGANIGMNLKALKLLFPDLKCEAVEINKEASVKLKELLSKDEIHEQSIIDFKPKKIWDLVLIKGVLIHINPNFLSQVYENLYHASNKYILICEYYNTTPTKIEYRGIKDKLFKRDFAGEMMQKFEDLKLLDYGFAYHKDDNFPQDDISWFLLRKGNG